MKPYHFLAAILVLLLSSCATALERRIAHDPERYAKLTAAEKESAQRGEVYEGMSRDAVYFAWGRPARVFQGRRDGKNRERWSYVHYEAVHSFGYGGGLGYYGGCGYYAPFAYSVPVVDYLPTPGRFAEFTNGKVTSFMVPR